MHLNHHEDKFIYNRCTNNSAQNSIEFRLDLSDGENFKLQNPEDYKDGFE